MHMWKLICSLLIFSPLYSPVWYNVSSWSIFKLQLDILSYSVWKKTSDRFFFFPSSSFRASLLCLKDFEKWWQLWFYLEDMTAFTGAVKACYDFDQVGKISLYMFSRNLIEPNMGNVLKYLFWCLMFRFCILVLEGIL